MEAHVNGRRWSVNPSSSTTLAKHLEPSLFDYNERLAGSLHSNHADDVWRAEVEAKLHMYRACLLRHVRAADGERGWIADLRGDAPRVEPLARRARADFARLDAHVLSVMASLRHPARAMSDVRHDLRRLIELTRRHRGRCARLVHEAWGIDLGVG